MAGAVAWDKSQYRRRVHDLEARRVSLQRPARRTLARVLDKKTTCNVNTETRRPMLGSGSMDQAA